MSDLSTQSHTAKKPWLRVAAIAVAAILLIAMFLNEAVRIHFAAVDFRGTILEQAAAITKENSAYLNEGKLSRIWDLLCNAIGQPKTYEEYDTFASMAIARDDYEAAATYLQGCIDTYSDTSDGELSLLYLRKGCIYALLEQYEPAIGCFDEVEKLAPQTADNYLLRAQMYTQLGQLDPVMADIEKYTALAGKQPNIQAAIAPLYEAQGKYAEAKEAYTAAIENTGIYSVDLLFGRARCAMILGDAETARQDLLRYLQEGGSDSQGGANAMLGICQMSAGAYQEALDQFGRALAGGYPYPFLLHTQMVLCGYVLGDYQAVVDHGREAIKMLTSQTAGVDLFPKDSVLMNADSQLSEAELHQWVGLGEMALGNYTPALEEFQKAQQQNPDLSDLDYYSGVCNTALKQYQAAIRNFSASIQKEQMVSLSYYNRGVCRMQVEAYQDALNDLLAVIQRNDDPSAVEAANALLAQFTTDTQSSEASQGAGN